MTIIYFILAAIALGILVFIHELGHYFAARMVGMRVEVFSIGFGRPLFKWKWQDVEWQLAWLPFGGYVKIAGMEMGKKNSDPSEVENGFFSKSPWKRILVAIAGPLANFILAFLLFIALWGMGGREKPFSEFTHYIGWVDPQSELYSLGIKPGDILTKYDGMAYTNSKELIYAAMLGDKKVTVEGFHVDEQNGQKTPFNYTVETYPSPSSLDGLLTMGILSPTRYMIFSNTGEGYEKSFPEGSPMAESGIQFGDRILWADGKILYSLDQMSNLLNDRRALLTVERDGQIFLTRQPKVSLGDLSLSSSVRDEIKDWQFAIAIKGKFSSLSFLPYDMSNEGIIEGHLSFIDEESERAAFPKSPNSKDNRLKIGDRIVAVDGLPIKNSYEILKLLQIKHVNIIVDRSGTNVSPLNFKNEDWVFEHSINRQDLNALSNTIGNPQANRQIGTLVLLNSVIPKKIGDFSESPEAKAQIASQIEAQKQKILEIKDKDKRVQALKTLDESQNKYVLGIYLQDRNVQYNPNPAALFGDVFSETWRTLKALIFGYLNPKWLSGPIGIVQVLHHGWAIGIGEALFWIAAISVNLGVLNLLPIPVLDGGYICFALWEIITGKRLKAKTIEKLIVPFVVLLVGLLIFLTFQDISRFF